jgi:hypothetical protein
MQQLIYENESINYTDTAILFYLRPLTCLFLTDICTNLQNIDRTMCNSIVKSYELRIQTGGEIY